MTQLLTATSTQKFPPQTDIVPLITCIMSAQYPPTAVERCLPATNSPIDYADWQACMAERGPGLLHDLGVETHGLSPRDGDLLVVVIVKSCVNKQAGS